MNRTEEIKLLEQLEQWNSKDEYSQCIQAIEAIPEQERGYLLTVKLSRAYSNLAVLGDHGVHGTDGEVDEDLIRHAIDLLESVRTQGENDPYWNSRMGYSCLMAYRSAATAYEYAKCWLALAPDDPAAQKLVRDCEEYLEEEKALELDLKEVERQARHVDLPAIEILEIKFPVVKFRVECSKGTYIRSLCADIGEKLCCGGTMQSLVRTRVGEFRLADALTLAQLQELRDTERLEEALLPTDRIFSDFPMLHVEEKWRKLIDNGNAFYPGQTVEQTTHPAGEWVRIYREDDSFVGIYAYDETKEWYKPVKIFPSNTESRK